MDLRRRWNDLIDRLKSYDRVLVAFSGGCDSAFLAAAAQRVLGNERMLAITAVSESLSEFEKKSLRGFISQFRFPHRYITTQELKNPSYQSNPANRCFFCKDELFAALAPIARDHGMRVADGFNASDTSDYRPGASAAKRWGVAHPLAESFLNKEDIRALSRWMKLPTWNKPASPCLSSRVPYGTAITAEVLRRIERAEAALRSEGFFIARVRHYDSEARIEVPLHEIARLQEKKCWGKIFSAIRSAGYEKVSIDPRGFRSGRLNEKIFLQN